MKSICLVAGVLFFAAMACAMAMVVIAGLMQIYRGPSWSYRIGGLALVVTMSGIVTVCVYGLTECVRLLANA